eukprot:CAMPEP_0185398410 /NCGR_PEP_ID=MMETSP1364-20130426/88801_1 /TAXON_ID=38817 /ORGANISM="Gephyrocapsa oceanica, Strain RCC1303" /LENGTH=83 /DNA_ID=CAMNT_0028000667 /DNA_START=50 /DNA_END=298 /DNA_ORIENTATION=+
MSWRQCGLNGVVSAGGGESHPKLITVPKLSFAPREEGAIAGAAGVEDRADPAHTQQNHGQSPQRQEQEECGGEAAHRRETAEV